MAGVTVLEPANAGLKLELYFHTVNILYISNMLGGILKHFIKLGLDNMLSTYASNCRKLMGKVTVVLRCISTLPDTPIFYGFDH